jgi:V/A-type H+-transporting ATPase subunit I
MANARVQRIEFLIHSSVRDDLLDLLADAGAVELEALDPEERGDLPPPSPVPADEAGRDYGTLRQALGYLDRFAPKAGFFASMMGYKVEVSAAELETHLRDFDAVKAAGEVLAVQSSENEARSHLARLEEERALLTSWLGLQTPPDSLGATENTFSAAYALNPQHVPRLREKLAEEVGELFELVDLGASAEHGASAASGRIVLIWHRTVDEKLRESLKGFDLNPCPLTGPLTPAGALARVESEIETREAELEDVLRRVEGLLEYRDPLYLALDEARTESEGQRLVADSAATDEAIYLRGWVPETAVEGVESILEKRELVHYTLRPPTEEETPPVYLSNAAPVRPFEMVTDLYGRPQPAESDPTPFFAFFFALFFGICLTDAGYGLLLIASSLLFLKLLPLGPTTRKMFRMMVIAGVFTVIVGVLTGGFFGLSFEWSPALSGLRETLMVLDPLDPDQMFYFFYFSLGLGYLHLFIGYLIGLFEALRRKDTQTALFRKLPWLLVMLLVPLAVGLPMLGASGGWAWYGVIAVGLYVVAFSGVGDDSGLPRLGAGIFNLYTGFSGLFSDILSYARLFALGLATAVIAQVVNTMAFDSNVVGMVLILAVGHVFNLAMNALGGFIHTARLQFVEYFGKFYTGGGRTFVPYARSMEHTVLKG